MCTAHGEEARFGMSGCPLVVGEDVRGIGSGFEPDCPEGAGIGQLKSFRHVWVMPIATDISGNFPLNTATLGIILPGMRM
jgi:hypothetical protein